MKNMKNALQLPENYHEILKMDMQTDKRPARIVNAVSAVTVIAMTALGNWLIPLTVLFASDNPALIAVRLLTAAAGTVLYLFLHEPIHGIFMEKLSGAGTKYGITGIFAYAGSEAYFNKRSYLVISLAPVIICGIALTLLCCVIPDSVFWIIYFIQTVNLASAVGDFYVAWVVLRMPEDILIQDTGLIFSIYGLLKK